MLEQRAPDTRDALDTVRDIKMSDIKQLLRPGSIVNTVNTNNNDNNDTVSELSYIHWSFVKKYIKF